MELWDRVKGLHGQVLQTVQGARFTVEGVTDSDVLIYIWSTKKKRHIRRTEIEAAFRLMTPSTRLRPSEIRSAGISERSPAYVAGIIPALSS